jgi:hypothetical protein
MADFAKDPSNTYRKAYYDKLNNQISILSGKFIPIYDVVPDNAVAPYIILSSTILTPHLISGEYLFNATIVIDIVTRFITGGGQKMVNDISNQVFSKILLKETFYSDETWNIYTSSLNDTRSIEMQSVNGTVIRKLLTFKNSIQQLS